MSKRYVATAPLLPGAINPDRMTADELRAFATVVEQTFGSDPFRLHVDYDSTFLVNRLLATEPLEDA